jgi:hypothetical protein
MALTSLNGNLALAMCDGMRTIMDLKTTQCEEKIALKAYHVEKHYSVAE